MAVKDFEGFAQLLTNENLQKNKELRDKLKEAVTNVDADAVIQIGKEHGYDFTLEDIQAFHEEQGSDEELSDEDLENVAGGVVFPINQAAITALLVSVYGVQSPGMQASIATSSIATSGGGW